MLQPVCKGCAASLPQRRPALVPRCLFVPTPPWLAPPAGSQVQGTLQVAPLHQPAGGGNRSAGRCGPIAQRPCPLVSSRRHRNATGQRLAAVVEHAAAARRVSCVQSGAGGTREAGCFFGMAPPQRWLAAACCPAGTEACASVTSAFLQVLATIHRVEAARLDRPRNVLQVCAPARQPATRPAPVSPPAATCQIWQRQSFERSARADKHAPWSCQPRRARPAACLAHPRRSRLSLLLAAPPARSYPPTLGAPRLWSCPRARTGWPTSCAGTRCPTARAGTTPPTWTATDTAQTTTTCSLVSQPGTRRLRCLASFLSRMQKPWSLLCGVCRRPRRRRWLPHQPLLQGPACTRAGPPRFQAQNTNCAAWSLSRLLIQKV